MYKELTQMLTDHQVTLVAVSKTKPLEQIMELYNMGQRDFGENRVQELVEKYEALPKDIRWHQIGHLQTNKVKYLAPFVHLIHSIDSFKLLKEVNRRAEQEGRIQPVLLQFKIAKEDTKYGLTLEESLSFFEGDEFTRMNHVEIQGVMGMATFTDDQEQVRDEFQSLKRIFDTLKETFFVKESFKEISMGMSGDYKLAVEQGSTMVRIGSLLFGAR